MPLVIEAIKAIMEKTMAELSPEQIEVILRDPTGDLYLDLEGESERNQVIAVLREKFAFHMRIYLADPNSPRGKENRQAARRSVLATIDGLEGEEQLFLPWMKSRRTHPAFKGVQPHSLLDRAVGPFMHGHTQFKD